MLDLPKQNASADTFKWQFGLAAPCISHLVPRLVQQGNHAVRGKMTEIVIVHEQVSDYGGTERVLEGLANVFPGAAGVCHGIRRRDPSPVGSAIQPAVCRSCEGTGIRFVSTSGVAERRRGDFRVHRSSYPLCRRGGA